MSSSRLQVWRDIGELLTLKGAAQKSGRYIHERDLSIIKNAALVIRNGQIEWVGQKGKIPKKYAQEKTVEKSFSQRTLMPAFVESHTHSVFAGDRSDEFEMRNCGIGYQEIAEKGGGILSTVKRTRRASLEDLTCRAQAVIDGFIKQGVTTVEVKSGYALNLSGEIKMLEAIGNLKKARIVATFLGAHAVGPDFEGADEYLNYLIQRVFPVVARKKLAHRVDIFIERGYFNLQQARRYLDEAKKYGFDITIHADQLNRTGAALLAVEYGACSADHVIELTDRDISKVAKSEVTCGLLPSADFYIGCSYPKARKLLEKGARVALATDYNPGSSPTQDLSFVGVLARLEMKMTLPEVLAAYTLNGAYALGLEKCLGSVEIGKEADLIALDGGWTDLFYRVGQMPIDSVYKSGRKCLPSRV